MIIMAMRNLDTSEYIGNGIFLVIIELYNNIIKAKSTTTWGKLEKKLFGIYTCKMTYDFE